MLKYDNRQKRNSHFSKQYMVFYKQDKANFYIFAKKNENLAFIYSLVITLLVSLCMGLNYHVAKCKTWTAVISDPEVGFAVLSSANINLKIMYNLSYAYIYDF